MKSVPQTKGPKASDAYKDARSLLPKRKITCTTENEGQKKKMNTSGKQCQEPWLKFIKDKQNTNRNKQKIGLNKGVQKEENDVKFAK